ncbi:hypothetical protein KSS87_011901 [Heliosperma pusillum]|nr:hypothetical protein KSS87_011901 [Heliosperma pusillum]
MSTRSFPFPINSFKKNKHAISPFPRSFDTTPYRRPTSDPPPILPPTPVPPSPLIFFLDISLLLCSLVESIRLTLICTLYAGLLVHGRLVGCLPCIAASKFREVPIIIDYFRLIRYCDIMVSHWITGRGRMLLKSWLQLSNIGAESSLTVMLLIWEGLGLRGGAATGEWARPRYIEFGWSLLAVPKKLLMRKIKSWIMENICSIN